MWKVSIDKFYIDINNRLILYHNINSIRHSLMERMMKKCYRRQGKGLNTTKIQQTHKEATKKKKQIKSSILVKYENEFSYGLEKSYTKR